MTVSSPVRRADTGTPDTAKPGATKPTTGKPTTDMPATGEKALYRVADVMRLLSLSRSVIYIQIRAGRLRSVKEGSTRLIPADAVIMDSSLSQRVSYLSLAGLGL